MQSLFPSLFPSQCATCFSPQLEPNNTNSTTSTSSTSSTSSPPSPSSSSSLSSIGPKIPSFTTPGEAIAAQIGLMEAIKKLDIFEVNVFLNQYVDVNSAKYHKAPLQYAVEHYNKVTELYDQRRNQSIIHSLLEARASPFIGTPFLAATCIKSETASLEITGWMLEAASEDWPEQPMQSLFNQRDMYGQIPLLCAIAENHPKVVALLLKHNADVNDSDYERNTPLIHAARRKSPPEMIDLLLEARADVNVVSNTERSALFYAKKYKDITLYNKLLERGLQVLPPPPAEPSEQGLNTTEDPSGDWIYVRRSKMEISLKSMPPCFLPILTS